MRRVLVIFVGAALLAAALWWGSAWIANGGWPGSGPLGEALPPHISFVRPADGETAAEPSGFCVHFNYQFGHGLGDEPEKMIRYFLDGRNVTKETLDLATLQYGYPDPVGEPCYRSTKPLKPGWHTAKVAYTDLDREGFSYTWRFQVLEAPE